jgi:hypothetical protein
VVEDDADTDLVLLYLESFGNRRKFGRSRAELLVKSQSWP